MSRELAGLLQARSRLDVMRWPMGIGLSVGIHVLVGAAILLGSRVKPAVEEDRKVTWVTLPAAGGTSGGSGAQEAGETGERVRRVEEVAPKSQDAVKGLPSPEGLSAAGKRTPVKGTSPDPASTGQAREASKGKDVNPNAPKGAAGSGGGGGVGQGTGVLGMPSGGASGGVGMIGELDGNFPYTWYLQQVQNRIAANWFRPTGVQGRVLIYFRIRPDGSLESIRRDTPSPSAPFNESAEQAVRRSSPMPPLPQGFDGKYLGVWFWFTSN